jgi:hypothetical protein
MSKIAGIAIPARRNAKVWTDAKDRPIRKGGSPGNSQFEATQGLPCSNDLK